MAYSWKIVRGLTEDIVLNILATAIVEESSVNLSGTIDRIEKATTFSKASEIALSEDVIEVYLAFKKSFLFLYRDFDKKGILIMKE